MTATITKNDADDNTDRKLTGKQSVNIKYEYKYVNEYKSN